MKKWNKYLPMAAWTLAVAVAAFFNLTAHAKEAEEETIPDRVYFGEVSVGGLNGQEAEEAVNEYLKQLGTARITLAAGDNTIETTAGDLGISWSNPDIVKEAQGLGKAGNLVVRYMAMKDLEHEDKVTPWLPGIIVNAPFSRVSPASFASVSNVSRLDSSRLRIFAESTETPRS